MKLTKMQGLGNTFLVLKGPFALSPAQVVDYCTENRTDGLLVVTPVGSRLVEMKYWNADGSVAEMCGNGLRCVIRFAIDRKLVEPGKFEVKTDAGQLKAVWDGEDSEKIEVQVGKVEVDNEPIIINSSQFYLANVGNPHAVTFVDDVTVAPVKELGPVVETDPHFVNKTNVEFVQLVSSHKISVRTWERGVGETQACGTGLVAATAISVGNGHVQYPVEVEVLGGTASVWLDDEGYSRMVGPAEFIK